jgi:hypothetical protein
MTLVEAPTVQLGMAITVEDETFAKMAEAVQHRFGCTPSAARGAVQDVLDWIGVEPESGRPDDAGPRPSQEGRA